MIAIQIVDYFILRKDSSAKSTNWINFVLWLTGFILYRFFMHINTPIGNTVPVMLITALLCMIADKTLGGTQKC
jgi:purine-cytosine permease-like protein